MKQNLFAKGFAVVSLIFTNRMESLILDVAYVIWLFPEIVYSYIHPITASARTNDRHSGTVLVACIWFGVFLAYRFASKATRFFISWHPVILFALGILIMVAGVIFRWYAIRALGKYFTLRIATQPGQTVVEHGPYRWIRHPSYTGALITMFGLGLVFTNWLSLLSVLVCGFVGYSYRIMIEEQTLISELGEPYRAYIKRTKRFIPFVY